MVIATLLLATTLTPGVVAMSIESPAVDRATIVHTALTDADARVRGAAARVVAVTDAKDLLGDVRAALAKETNAEAAREEIRAIGITNGVSDLDALLEAAKKFGLEGDAWIAVARGAGAAAVDAAIDRHVAQTSVFRYGLWDRSDLSVALTSKILGRGDAKLWKAWLEYLEGEDIPLSSQLGSVAVAHSNPEIATPTVWMLAKQYDEAPPADPKPLLDALDRANENRPNADTSESFARELLSRALGRAPKERDEWIEWVKSWKERGVSMWSHQTQLTSAERDAAHISAPPKEKQGVVKPSNVVEPAGNSLFNVMTQLPKGVGEEVLNAAGCDGEWLGFGTVTVDRAGRARNVDVKNVYASESCKRALNVLIRTSYARDFAGTSPPQLTANDVLLVHRGKTDNCLDEQDVVPGGSVELLRVVPPITPPKKIRSVEPVYPESERQARISGIIILETHINTNRCVEALKILKPLSPALNSSALIAVSQWRFTPATLNGKPVDVLFNLTINYKLR